MKSETYCYLPGFEFLLLNFYFLRVMNNTFFHERVVLTKQ